MIYQNMAAVVSTADMTIQKNSKILVNVEEVLLDLIVVTYSTEDKEFQGVLLDSKKSSLPFGVYNLHPAFDTEKKDINEQNGKLHSVSQRFTYAHPEFAAERFSKARTKAKSQKQQKMTVRLRPRKVLCSKCKGICNENNENMDHKRSKLDQSESVNALSHDAEKKFLMGSTLIPKLSRLQPSEISDAIKPSTKNKSERKYLTRGNERKTVDVESMPADEAESNGLTFVNIDEIMAGGKTNVKDANESSFSSLFSNAKRLKICFGEGEGTVVKIPPITGDCNEDSGVSCDMNKQSESKAAKRALKRAKKQAKKMNMTESGIKTGLSPNHMGALSPRNSVTDNQPNLECFEKQHKIKRKKRSKTSKATDENSAKYDSSEHCNYFSDVKDHCLNQKLSISLRRLSSNSFDKPNEDDSGSDEWESDMVPDFPVITTESTEASNIPLNMSAGDIVWGKVVGFPWWPGRLLSINPGTTSAHVSWYASSTSSQMPLDSLRPFLTEYKLRFNKKKRGTYKEAVKQAMIEAKVTESHNNDPLSSPTHSLAAMSPRPINGIEPITGGNHEKDTTELAIRIYTTCALPLKASPSWAAPDRTGLRGHRLRIGTTLNSTILKMLERSMRFEIALSPPVRTL